MENDILIQSGYLAMLILFVIAAARMVNKKLKEKSEETFLDEVDFSNYIEDTANDSNEVAVVISPDGYCLVTTKGVLKKLDLYHGQRVNYETCSKIIMENYKRCAQDMGMYKDAK